MGRKKKEAEVIDAQAETQEDAGQGPDPGQIDAIREKHGKLKAKVEQLRGNGEYYKRHLSREVRSHMLEQFEAEIRNLINDLENVDKKDLEKSQGHIAGLRHAHQMVCGQAWDSELVRAEDELRKFEDENALFLQDPAGQEDVAFDVPEGAETLIIETAILFEEVEDHQYLIRDLKSAGFNYVDQDGDNETELWTADVTDKARRFMGGLTDHPLVVECRAE